MLPAIMAGASGAGGMGAGASGAGFMQWLDMFNPEMKGGIMEKLGLLEPNKGAEAQNTSMQMSGMKPPQPPMPAMNMQQLQNMMQSMQQNRNGPQGLMAPQQKKPFSGGLWD